jgi:malonate transporter
VQGVLTGFVVIAVVIAVGYLLGLRGSLGEHGRDVLTRLAFNVASPALLFTTLARADLSVVFSSGLLVTVVSTAAVTATPSPAPTAPTARPTRTAVRATRPSHRAAA